MGKIERLHAAEKNAPRSPAREALAEAIDDAARHHNDVNAAQEAAAQARRNKWSAQARLDALLAEPERRDFGQRFMAASAAGESIGATALAGRPREDVVKELEREIDVWASTWSQCEKTAAEARDSLRYAESRLEGAADAVLRVSGTAIAADVVEGVENLQTALVERRVLLRFFERKGLIDDDELAKRVRNLLSYHFFPMAGGLGEWGNFDQHHRHQEWAGAREALKADADAPLPGGEI